jgi:hypothetical protein
MLSENEILKRLHHKLELVGIVPSGKKRFLVRCLDCGLGIYKNSHQIKQRCGCDKMSESRFDIEKFIKKLHPSLVFVERKGKIFYCRCGECHKVIRKWHDTLHKVCKCVADRNLIKPEHLKIRKKRIPRKNIYRDYVKPRKNRDINYRMSLALRGRMKAALRYQLKNREKIISAVSDLGCTVPEFVKYIENKFYNNPKTGIAMSWDNWAMKGWHLDHIVPLSKLDLADPKQAKFAAHYTNIQPLWWFENLAKRDKLL